MTRDEIRAVFDISPAVADAQTIAGRVYDGLGQHRLVEPAESPQYEIALPQEAGIDAAAVNTYQSLKMAIEAHHGTWLPLTRSSYEHNFATGILDRLLFRVTAYYANVYGEGQIAFNSWIARAAVNVFHAVFDPRRAPREQSADHASDQLQQDEGPDRP